MPRRRRPLLAALAVSALALGACFDLTSASSADEEPAPYRPDAPGSGHWRDDGNTTNPLLVLGHEFRAATIQNGYTDKGDNCVIYATVEFTAPRSEHLRFQAKITMSNGAWVKSPIFFNDTAGSREFTFNYDTARDGCWGATPHHASNLHVAACRGADCDPGLK